MPPDVPLTDPWQYYTVKQLMLLLEHINDPMGTYIAACTRHKEKWVASIEKMDVLNYLQGNTDSAAQVRAGAEEIEGGGRRGRGGQ